MGLITPSRERHYTAALAILLAEYTYLVMTPAEKKRVDEKVYANLDAPLIGFSKFEFQRMWPRPLKAAWRAVAMADLSIPPALDAEQWNLPKSRRWFGLPSSAPARLFLDFRAGHDATEQAKTYLAARGIDIQSLDSILQ